MNTQITSRITRLHYLILLLIIILAFYIAYIPHFNYTYPIHLDEWLALGSSQTMLDEGHFIMGSGQMGSGRYLEAGFHLFWGIFHQISGIPWMDIFRFFPGIIFIITVLSVYILAQRQGFGLEAAFFTSLMPTTVGILGPSFLVPLTMALPFIPLGLFIAFNYRTVWCYVILFVFICFLLMTHATTAVGLVIILSPYILLSLKGEFKHGMWITIAIVIPFLLPFHWIFDLVLSTARSLFAPQLLSTYVDYPFIIQTYGYLPIAICLLGVFLLAIRGSKTGYSLLLGLLTLLVMLATMYTLHHGVEIMYGRGLTYMMLMVSIIAGAGLYGIRNISLPIRFIRWLKSPVIRRNIGNILCLAVIAGILIITVPTRQNANYYHMIEEYDYNAFVWIRDNVNDSYQKAIVDPWKGAAFYAITQKEVYTAIFGYPKPSDEKAYSFLREDCIDTAFLKENGISIIYFSGECCNPDLVEVAENVYLLKETNDDE